MTGNAGRPTDGIVESATNRPIRILHVISGLGPGGAETVLYRLISKARATQHEVVCLGPREWFSARLEQQGVPVHHFDLSSPIDATRALFQLPRLARSSGADVVQCWMYRGNVVGGLAARMAGKPVVWNLRCAHVDFHPLPTRFVARLGGLLARWVPKAVLNCSLASRREHARLGYEAAEIRVIPNGYDPIVFRPDEAMRGETRRSLGAGDDTFLIAHIGRWDSTKAYPTLLEAIRRVKEKAIPLRVVLIGRGLEAANADLAKIIEQCGCGDIVELVGHRSDIPELARAADLHILSSITEGFPNVVAETMLSGTPNVATDVGDARVIVGDTGWIVPPSDPDRLAGAIEAAFGEWSASPEQWRARREASRERIATQFSLDRMIASYEDLWRQVVSATLSGNQQ